jgi:stringent starvation protein B
MRDQKPYLIRAFYDWIVDSNCTPYLQFLTTYPGVIAPKGFDEEGVLVLNISGQATNQLSLGLDFISFFARFRGQAMPVHVPIAAVLAIFAKENAQGMGFPPPDMDNLPLPEEVPELTKTGASTPVAAKPKRDRSHLKVIK